MTRTVRPGRTLTPAQVELVHGWAWGQRVVLAIFAPVTVLVAVLMGAGGFLAAAVGFQERALYPTALGLFLVAVSILLAMVPPVMWKGIASAGRTSLDTPVETFGGVYHLSRGKDTRPMIGNTVVNIPAGCPGDDLELGRYYEVDIIDGAPPLVVDIRRPVGSRRDRRRRKRARG